MSDDGVGRIVIITGGAGGVGTVVSRRWLETGASVLVVGQTDDSLNRFRAEVGDGFGVRLATLAADVATESGAAAMNAEARRVFGKPADTLVHLVGGFAMGRVDAPDAPSVWDRMIAMNLTASFHCYRAMLPGLLERGSGWIVGLGSRAAVTPGAQVAAYAASKAGLIALTQALAEEVKDQNIHVNVLLASTIDTPANRAAIGAKNAEKWVRPDDIADATLYLCSDRARAVNGATLEVYARA